ncbi:hypothetical protein SADUNF_Sadunf12G0014200 [Salix dunnii]|uniref:TF-B3 domain-containing protein n=1 Tax=Salix dunnii TaxID=1413687 RepID=A0A835JH38_9ROSI|nr:hypothetical protein SADUNF_Sadunf12G0014200 [Salix dunnii]
MAEFSKLLTNTDIQKKLSLPTELFKSLPSFNGGHVQDLQAMDECGFVWTFKCSTRKKGHPKPILSKGWLPFVRNKKLKVGDKIKFSVLDQTAGVPFYRVRAEKEVKIVGAIFGYAPIIVPSIPEIRLDFELFGAFTGICYSSEVLCYWVLGSLLFALLSLMLTDNGCHCRKWA